MDPFIIQTGINLGMAAFAKGQSNSLEDDLISLESQLASLEANRQPIVNPYEDITGYKPEDLSDSFTNPFANLRVATKAARMKAEETDVALANALDAVRMGRGAAGSATALANAAKQGKAEVAASIETQEVNNQKLFAQGEAQLQQRIAAEQARVQGIEASEAARVQNARAQGDLFMFQQQEIRDMQQLDRMQAKIDENRQNQANADKAMFSAFGDLAGSMTDMPGYGDSFK